MAKKRMFSLGVLETDAFMDMPLSAQALYFHLNMRADDDGFIGNPRRITQNIGANEDDLKLLIAKRFVLTFDDGVIVIKHWRMHNAIKKDRYTQTNFIDDLKMLRLKDNGSYTLCDTLKEIPMEHEWSTDGAQTERKRSTNGAQTEHEWSTDGAQMSQTCSTDIGIGLDIDKNSISNTNVLDCPTSSDNVYQKLTAMWNDELSSFGITSVRGIKASSKRASMLRARLKEYGEDSFAEIIQQIKSSDFLQGKHTGRPWQATFDWVIHPTNYPKVLEGNYRNTGSQECHSAFDNMVV